MKIEFLSKNFTAPEKLKDLIVKKIERLDKFFEADTKVKVVLKKSNDVETLELTVFDGSLVMRSEVSVGTMYDNIDIALPKIERQILKHKEKLASKTKKFRVKELSPDFVTAAEEKRRAVVRTKSYDLSPMTVEDAITELELVGHSFYVFLNKATQQTNVLYRRNDGDYGVIVANS